MSFMMCCNWSQVQMACNSQNHLFMPKMQINPLEKWTFYVMNFDEMWWCIMKVHVKCGLLKERSLNLAIPCESYATLNLGIFWKWLDHNLPTTHEKWVFLDFLEMGEQYLQLSCWTKIHLKLVWWSNFEEKNFPFLANSNYRSPAILGNFLSDLQILNLGLWYVKWDLYGHEWSLSNHLTPSNP